MVVTLLVLVQVTLSGRQDSNLRPSGPKPDALPPALLPEPVVIVQQQTATVAPLCFSLGTKKPQALDCGSSCWT